MSTWHTKDAHSGGYKNKRNKDGVRCKIKQPTGGLLSMLRLLIGLATTRLYVIAH